MKPKITPQDYKNILESLELDTLYLTELITKYKEDFVSASLALNIDEKNSFSQEGSILKVSYIYKLDVKDESNDEAAISMKAGFSVRYNIKKDIIVTKDFMKVFSDLTLGLLLWPYFRELVNNMVNRMGMPPLVLPMKKR